MNEDKLPKKRIMIYSVIVSILVILQICLLINFHSYYKNPSFQISQRVLRESNKPLVTIKTFVYYRYRDTYLKIWEFEENSISRNKIIDTLDKQEEEARKIEASFVTLGSLYDITEETIMNSSCNEGGEKEKNECYQKLSDTSQN